MGAGVDLPQPDKLCPILRAEKLWESGEDIASYLISYMLGKDVAGWELKFLL